MTEKKKYTSQEKKKEKTNLTFEGLQSRYRVETQSSQVGGRFTYITDLPTSPYLPE